MISIKSGDKFSFEGIIGDFIGSIMVISTQLISKSNYNQINLGMFVYGITSLIIDCLFLATKFYYKFN